MSHLNLCHLLNLFSNASDALRAARADGRHYVPLSLNRLGRVINTHGDILVSNAYTRRRDVRRGLRRGASRDHRRGQRHGTRHVVTSAAAKMQNAAA